MENQKLIIITTKSKLQTVNSSADFDGFDSLQNKGFLKYENGKLVGVNNLNNVDIVFVWDRNVRGAINDTGWWNNFVKQHKKENEEWYVVYHSKGIQPHPNDNIIRKGKHLSDDPAYGKIAEILLDAEDNKKERIIKAVFSIEPILKFLHDCLEKKPEATDFKNLEEDAGIELPKFELKGELYDDEYFNCLSELRDELLKRVI